MVAITKLGLLAAILALAPATANAASGRPCVPRAADARVHVSLLADSDLTALVKWAKEQTCLDYVFEPSLGGRRLTQAVIVTVTGADVETMVEVLLHAMNLDIKSKGKQRLIVAIGPESTRSKNIREREKAYLDRDRIFDHIEGEITKKDDTHFAITRRGLDAALVNVSSVGRTVRLAPEAKDGKPVGFRVLSLRPGSLLARVGLLRGDLVVSVNGVDITGPNKALELYTRIRSADDIQFSVLREGKPLALETKVE